MGVGQTQGHVKRGNGADAGSGVMRGWEWGERRWCRERGWEQDECGQRGEQSQVLLGLAQPSCLGRHTSRAAGLLGACQLQPLPAHIGRGARGRVGGSVPRAPSITAGSLAPLETGWTRASGSKPPGPGTERENAVELFLPMLPSSLALLPGNQPCLAGGLPGAGLGRERNSSLRGVCSSRPPSQRGLGRPGAPCCSRGRRCPSQLQGCERLGGSPAPPLCRPSPALRSVGERVRALHPWGAGSGGGWISWAPTAMASRPPGWLCLGRAVQPGGRSACACLWVQAGGGGVTLTMGGAMGVCCHSFGKVLGATGCSGAPWGCHSGALGGGKLRRPGDRRT